MATLTIYEGKQYRIEAWAEGDRCGLLEFLESLKRDNGKEYDRIWARIKTSADDGPPRNIHLCRKLEGDHAEGLLEFKTGGGVRVLWFYDKGKLIICTHGFVKKRMDTPRREIERAQRIRQIYFQQKNSRLVN
jgi:phage-related protein